MASKRQATELSDNRRFPKLDIFLFHRTRYPRTYIITDQLTDGRGEIKIHRIYIFCHKIVFKCPSNCFAHQLRFFNQCQNVPASSLPKGSSPMDWQYPSRRPADKNHGWARTMQRPFPTDAEGNSPSEPLITLASSLRISPNIFSVRITSNCFGLSDDLHGSIVHK